MVASLCVAALAASCGGPGPGREGQPEPVVVERVWPAAPVIVISIDTLRSDHLPAYGYGGVETPHIDRLRADGVLFARAYSHSPLTLPSHASLLSGLLPAGHGVRNNIGFTFDGDEHPTIPSLLSAAGYATGAAVSAYVLRAGTGLGPLFDDFDDRFLGRGDSAGGSLERPAPDTVRVASEWIGPRADAPFFFFLHLFEPHTPYDPPQPFRGRYASAYDGEIAAADAAVGQFLDGLRRIGVYDRALIILLSDHGEGLGDHGEDEHGVFLYRETLQVPLIVKLPGGEHRGATVLEPVQLIDVMPSVTALIGLPLPAGVTGRPLFPAAGEAVATRRIVAETWVPRLHYGWSELWSLIEGPLHYIEGPGPELYDLDVDPSERHNLASSRGDAAERMATGLRPFIRPLESPGTVDPAQAEQLRALGYLGVLAVQRSGPLPDPKDRIETLHLLSEATSLAAAGDVDQAVQRLQKIIAENPGFVAGQMQLARVAQEHGRLDLAIRNYEEIVRSSPSLTSVCAAALATLHLRRGDSESAEAWARRCVDAGGAVGHLILGRIHLSRGLLPAAENEARLAMADSVHRTVGAVLLAEVLAASGRLVEGLEVAAEVERELAKQKLAPVERLHLVHGDILARLKRYDESEKHFLREISSYPSNIPAYTNLAVLYHVTNRPSEARAILERMVAANPGPHGPALAARTLRMVGDIEAAAAWQRLIEEAPPTAQPRRQAP